MRSLCIYITNSFSFCASHRILIDCIIHYQTSIMCSLDDLCICYYFCINYAFMLANVQSWCALAYFTQRRAKKERLSSLTLYLGNYADIKKLCSQLKIYCDELENSVQAQIAYRKKFNICIQTGIYIYIYRLELHNIQLW